MYCDGHVLFFKIVAKTLVVMVVYPLEISKSESLTLKTYFRTRIMKINPLLGWVICNMVAMFSKMATKIDSVKVIFL